MFETTTDLRILLGMYRALLIRIRSSIIGDLVSRETTRAPLLANPILIGRNI